MGNRTECTLPPGSALVKFLCYNANDVFTGERGAAYTALVIRPDADAERVISDFGPFPYDQFLREWRERLARSPEYRPDDQRASMFRERLWEPIEELLGPSTRTLYIAPDGELTRLPWAALPGRGTNRILLEDYALAIVPDGRLLLEQLTGAKKAHRDAGCILALGDIRYGEPKHPDRERALTRPSRSGSGAETGSRWPDLPGTGIEVDTIAMLAQGREVIRLTGEDATAARLRRELTGARWAHLGTHGFFQDPAARQLARFQELMRRDHRFSPPVVVPEMRRELRIPAERNPLSLSGLVLAGANKAAVTDKDGAIAGDGGILTAATIANLPLQDLDLVVLSACETGLGDIGYGEGAFSLERAFHAAGVRKVVATLWNVNDEATAALMRVFYHEVWLNKKPAIEALREAQLAIYYHPERIKALAESRGPDFAREVTLAKTSATGGMKPANRGAGEVLGGLRPLGRGRPERPLGPLQRR